MPTHRTLRVLAAILAPALAGCVDLLGDYKTSGCERADCTHWARRFGDENEQSAAGVAVTPEDDIVLLSNVIGAIDFGGGTQESEGQNDLFVAKLDPGGTRKWSLRFGGGGADYGNAIAVDPDGNILVAGTFSDSVTFGETILSSAGGKDAFVAKLDPAGKVLWAKGFGDPFEQSALGVTSDPAGNVLVTGCMAGSMIVGPNTLTSAGTDDAFVIKLSPNGSPTWGFSTGSAAASECGFRVAADDSGNVLVAGDFAGSVTFEKLIPAIGMNDIFVAKLSPAGAPLWSAGFGGVGNEIVGGIAVQPGGRVVVAGSYQGTVAFGGNKPLTAKGASDPFVLTLGPNGQAVWSRGLGGAQNDLVTGAAIDSQGDILIAGYGGPDAVNIDPFVAKIGTKGEVVWTHTWPASDSQEATAIAVDSQDETILAGRVSGTLGIAGTTVESAGANDVLVAKLGKDTDAPE